MQRFVLNEFEPREPSTVKKCEFYPSIYMKDSLFELKIIDLPVVPFFPANNVVEWTDYRYFGLRSASAYLMVYDVSSPSSFQFIKMLHDQMYETRDMTNIPIIVAANKMDIAANVTFTPSTTTLIPQILPSNQRKSQRNGRHLSQQDNAQTATDAANLEAANNTAVSANMAASPWTSGGATVGASGVDLTSHHPTGSNFSRVNSCVGTLAPGEVRNQKEIMALVKKSWRSSYVECSAMYNWNVVNVFRELAVTLDMIANGQVIGSQNSNVTKKKRCLMF